MIKIRQTMETAINSLDFNYYISSSAHVLDGVTVVGTKLYSCDTLHLRIGRTITLAGIGAFTIVDMELNEWAQIDYIGDLTLLPKVATTYPIFFEYGTLKDTDYEREDYKSVQLDRLPMFWLRTPLDEIYQDDFSNIDTILNAEFFILDWCYPMGVGENPTKVWYTSTHEKEVVEPMKNLFNGRFLTYLRKNPQIFAELTDTTKTVRGRAFISQEAEDGGTKTLFSENLSGVQVRMDIGFRKQTCCN